jgi:hypothetical protein
MHPLTPLVYTDFTEGVRWAQGVSYWTPVIVQ